MRIVLEFGHGQRRTVCIDGNRSRTGGIHADTDDFVGRKLLVGFFSLLHGFLNRNRKPFKIVSRILTGDIVVGLVQIIPACPVA